MSCFGGLDSSFNHTAIVLNILRASFRITFGTTLGIWKKKLVLLYFSHLQFRLKQFCPVDYYLP